MMIEDINKVLINKNTLNMDEFLLKIKNNNVDNQDIISFMKSLIASDIKLEENDRFSCISLGGLDEKIETIISFILKELNVDFNSTSDILSKNKNLSDIYVKFKNNNNYLLTLSLLLSGCINEKISNIVLDIKVGNIIKNDEEVENILKLVKLIEENFNLKVTCFVTNYSMSLGTSFGKNLELKEIEEILKGENLSSLATLAIKFSAYIYSCAKKISLELAQNKILDSIKNGSIYNYFKQSISDDIVLSKRLFSIKSSKTGFVKKIDILELKDLLVKVGALEDKEVGVVFSKQMGDYVLENEELAKVYLNNKDILTKELLDCFEIDDKMGEVSPLVTMIVR